MNTQPVKLNSTHLLVITVTLVCLLIWGNRTNTQSKPIAKNQPTATPTLMLTANFPEPKINLPSTPGSVPQIYANSYVLIDHDSKYAYVSKNADVPVPIASTTKIMTALIALETLDLNSVITISKEANMVEGSKIDFFTGEKIVTKELLYALMLHSANNAAYALAQSDGSLESFVEKMNQKAKHIGLRNTFYADPAGLSDLSQSTPRDLAILIDFALDNPTFRELIGTDQRIIVSSDGQYSHEVKNSNRLILNDEPLYLPSVIGGKTGFTYEAGHCLVAVATINSKRYIAAVLRTASDTKEASAIEVRKLFMWANKLN